MDTPGPPTEDLLRRARAGDEDARGRLLEAYRSYLALLARLQLGRDLQGKVDPSDLVQEVFLEAHRDWGQFRGQTEGELRAWLRRMLATCKRRSKSAAPGRSKSAAPDVLFPSSAEGRHRPDYSSAASAAAAGADARPCRRRLASFSR